MAARQAIVKSILTPTSGFIKEAGFTHSLTPARNCTFGCTYCYVPTMGIYGGLKPEDWQRWGQFTTFKINAADLVRKSMRPAQVVYCSPLVDPYQPAEAEQQLMPAILDAVAEHAPAVFVIQTRGPLILRDIDLLRRLHQRTLLRISFSLTTDHDEIRKLYEPLCASIPDRLDSIRRLRGAGLRVYATLAPILPCDPERLADLALECTDHDVIGDPFHVRSVKTSGATTREAGIRVSSARGFAEWHDPEYQRTVVDRIARRVESEGRRFGIGPAAFGWLAERNHAGRNHSEESRH